MTTYIKCGIGSSHSNKFFGKAITWTTTKWWKVLSKKARFDCPTHSFTWFEDSDGNIVYFEALEGDGFSGPHPISKMDNWVAEKPDERWHREFDLTLWVNPQEAYNFAQSMLGRWKYNTKRLILQLRIMGLGRRIIPASPDDVICSEATSRIMCTSRLYLPEWAKKKNHDDLSPRTLEDAVKKLLKIRC